MKNPGSKKNPIIVIKVLVASGCFLNKKPFKFGVPDIILPSKNDWRKPF